ncbi:MAG: hypothetical protein Q8P59_11150, partial [Dehalococcoidia bacterium]|nr:hypothetical protein [Dehalococcoidia bacterium]
MSAIDAANKPLEPPTAISLARLRKREGVLDNLGYTFERRMPVILPIVAFVLIMAVWETAIGVMKMVDPLLLSSPSSIVKKGWEMFFVT